MIATYRLKYSKIHSEHIAACIEIMTSAVMVNLIKTLYILKRIKLLQINKDASPTKARTHAHKKDHLTMFLRYSHYFENDYLTLRLFTMECGGS